MNEKRESKKGWIKFCYTIFLSKNLWNLGICRICFYHMPSEHNTCSRYSLDDWHPRQTQGEHHLKGCKLCFPDQTWCIILPTWQNLESLRRQSLGTPMKDYQHSVASGHAQECWLAEIRTHLSCGGYHSMDWRKRAEHQHSWLSASQLGIQEDKLPQVLLLWPPNREPKETLPSSCCFCQVFIRAMRQAHQGLLDFSAGGAHDHRDLYHLSTFIHFLFPSLPNSFRNKATLTSGHTKTTSYCPVISY